MLINGRTHKVFNFDDINSLVSLEDWLKKNLSLYPEDKKISKGHMLSFIEYIRGAVKVQRVEEKKEWLDKLDALTKRLKDD